MLAPSYHNVLSKSIPNDIPICDCPGDDLSAGVAGPAAATAASSDLGKSTVSCDCKNSYTFSCDAGLRKAILRQDLHEAAKQLLDDDRLHECMALRADKDRPVELQYDPVNGKSRFGNVCRCGNPWNCPNCGPIESEIKNLELREDLAVWEAAGFSVVAVHFTLQHRLWEPLTRSLDRLTKAFRYALMSRTGREFCEKWEVAGRRTSPDVTITEQNGWHPHRHTIWFLERRPLSPAELAEFEGELSQLWQYSCIKVGGFADLDHGVVAKADHIFEVADYITSKTSGNIEDFQAQQHLERAADRLNSGGWTLSEELTKAHLKEAQGGGLSPNQLLFKYLWGDERAGQLWVEYAEAFKGRKFLDTSKGLRKRLDELKELHQVQLEELRQAGELEKKPQWNTLAYISSVALSQVVSGMLQQWLLWEIKQSRGDPLYIRGFLEENGIFEVFCPDLDGQYPDWWLVGSDPSPGLADDIREANRFFADWNAGIV